MLFSDQFTICGIFYIMVACAEDSKCFNYIPVSDRISTEQLSEILLYAKSCKDHQEMINYWFC